MTTRALIVGLGNPGKTYENTRHNVGFWAVEALARRHALNFGTKPERKALIADGIINGRRVLLAKPQTYMNLSGEAVRGLMDFYKIDLSDLLIIADDLDLPLGTLRLRKDGSHGGQNGIRSIIQHLGTSAFTRARIGIGRPPGKMPASAYVLQAFKGDDEILAHQMIDRTISAVETWLKDGIELAMTHHNGSIDNIKS